MTNRIDADIMIIGDGEVIKNGTVVIEGSKISYAGEQEHAPNVKETEHVPVIMPGLWDTHAHFVGLRTANIERVPFISPILAGIRTVWDAREALYSGITSVRDAGGLGIQLNQAIQEGFVEGPRIYGSGKLISPTAGHGDIHNLPLDIVEHLTNHMAGGFSTIADGVTGCYRAVRMQLREGAEVIKYCASGGVMSKIDHPIHQQFSQEEQNAIVAEAARAEVAVMAHCHGAPGIKAALEAGVKSIEHGTYLDEDLADLMIEKDAILVPTRYVVQKLVDHAASMGSPDYVIEKINVVNKQHIKAIKIAIDKGVKIAMGTDIFTSGPDSMLRWGENAWELKYLVDAGLSTKDAIIAGTSMGPQTLGKRAPKSGALKLDYDADLLILKSNPIDDIAALTDRENILHVVKQGKFVY